LPDDHELTDELAAQEREVQSDGEKFKLMKKLEVKKKIGRSPDKGDAVGYLYAAVRAQSGSDADIRIREDEMLIIAPGDSVDINKSDNPDFDQELEEIMNVIDGARRSRRYDD